MHAWWPHVLSWPRAFDPISWFWLSGKGYAFTSSGLQLTIPAAAFIWLRHHNCNAPWCLRLGRHATADGHHHLCRKHHPDLPDRKLSLAEIHERHRAATGDLR